MVLPVKVPEMWRAKWSLQKPYRPRINETTFPPANLPRPPAVVFLHRRSSLSLPLPLPPPFQNPPARARRRREIRSARDVAQLRLAGPLQGQGLRHQAPLHGIGTTPPPLPDPRHSARLDPVPLPGFPRTSVGSSLIL